MPYLDPQQFQQVRDALQSGHDFFAGADKQELANALKLMDDASRAVAPVQLRDLAESIHGSDDIEIDDEGAGTSVTDDGTWVQAWVWVPQEDIAVTEDTDEPPELLCQHCGEPLTSNPCSSCNGFNNDA